MWWMHGVVVKRFDRWVMTRAVALHSRNQKKTWGDACAIRGIFFFSLDGEEKSGENAASFLHFPQTRDSKFWWDGKTLLYSTESPDSFLALFFASLAMVWKAKQLAGVFLGNFSGWKNTYAQKAPSHLGPGLKKWVGPKRMKKNTCWFFGSQSLTS